MRGEEKHRVDFYNDLDELGFESSFRKNFGKSSDNYIKEFNGIYNPASMEGY